MCDHSMCIYTEELEEVVLVDHVTQAPAVSQLVACLQPLPLEDPFLLNSDNALR